MARLSLRAAVPRDADRLIADGVLNGALPPGDSWQKRIALWLDEMQGGRRLVMIAEYEGKLVGLSQLVYKFANGYVDAEAANGAEIAMVEAMRLRPDAPPNLATHMINELQTYARKRRITTLTFLVHMDNNRALNQVKGWGFEEFRIMPEGGRLLAFFRKRIG